MNPALETLSIEGGQGRGTDRVVGQVGVAVVAVIPASEE
jgi:hypothetical protein